MRVGILIYGDIASQSGGYLYDRQLVNCLQQQGDTVEIFSLPFQPYSKAIFNQYDLNKVVNTKLDVLIQDELVHASVYHSNPQFIRQTGIPVAGLVHLFSAYANQPLHRRLLLRYTERAYINTVNGLILNSNNSLQQAKSLIGGNNMPPHLVAVPAGNNFGNVQIPETAKLTSKSAPLKLLYVGNVIRQKGLHLILHAMQRLPKNRFTLTVAGRLDMEPDYVNRIRQTIMDLNLYDQVKITGPLDREPLAIIYQSHHLFVLPSVNEAYGIVYVEAQQFGLPAIATTAGGAREIISDGENGYLIKPGDITTLTKLLNTLNDDRQLLQALGTNALNAYRQHPAWDDTGKQIRNFLHQLISPRGN